MKSYRLGLRSKVIITMIVGTLLFGAVILFVVYYYLNQTLTKSLISQGVIIGNSLSELAAEKLIEEDIVALRNIIEKNRAYPNIEYILIEDADRRIKTDTFNGQIPPELLNRAPFDPTSGQNYTTQVLSYKLSPQIVRVYDVLIPIREGLLGFVRVGMAKATIDRQIQKTVFIVSGVIIGGLLLAIIMALTLITVQVTQPVLHLRSAAEKISLGDFDTTINIRVKNELQDLGVAIDRMRESLKTCMQRLKVRSTI